MSAVLKCPDCGGTRLVEDHANGDVVCRECGLVVESHIIDERSEWRTFADKDREGVDPNRVGGPTDPLLNGGALSTVIGKGQGDGGLSNTLNRLQTRSNDPDRKLLNAFRKIAGMCDDLELASGVKDAACSLYKEVMATGQMKGKGQIPVAAGCLYMAARNEGNPRTFKEITAVLPSNVKQRDIGRCFTDLVQALKDKAMSSGEVAGTQAPAGLAPVIQHSSDYIKRWNSDLRLGHNVFRACRDMALVATPKEGSGAELKAGAKKQAWDSRSPLSVAAAVIFVVTMLCKDPVDQVNMQHIVVVTGVSESTIHSVYRDLYPELYRLVPKYHASEDDVKSLPPPS